jgi:hypothetical protein
MAAAWAIGLSGVSLPPCVKRKTTMMASSAARETANLKRWRRPEIGGIDAWCSAAIEDSLVLF